MICLITFPVLIQLLEGAASSREEGEDVQILFVALSLSFITYNFHRRNSEIFLVNFF